MKKPNQRSAERPQIRGLDEFLGQLAELPSLIVQGMTRVTDADELRPLVASFGESFQDQMGALVGHLRRVAARTSPEKLDAAEEVLALGGARTMARAAGTLAARLDSPAAKLGLSGIISMIKKIIKALLDVFHITLPDWVDKILDLIDEILNMLLSPGAPKLAAVLSRQHQDYLRELILVERQAQASAWRRGAQSEDDDAS